MVIHTSFRTLSSVSPCLLCSHSPAYLCLASLCAGLVRIARRTPGGVECPLLAEGQEEWLFIVDKQLVRLSFVPDLHAPVVLTRLGGRVDVLQLPGDGRVVCLMQDPNPPAQRLLVREAWRAHKWILDVRPRVTHDMCADHLNAHARLCAVARPMLMLPLCALRRPPGLQPRPRTCSRIAWRRVCAASVRPARAAPTFPAGGSCG